MIQKGGLLMWPILGISVASIAIFVERLIVYRRNEVNTAEFLRGIVSLVRRGRFAEALERCEEAHGPVAQVAHAAVQHHSLAREEMKEFLGEVAQLQVPRLEQHLVGLSTIGYLAPLLGLLGTVTGMISVFIEVQNGAGTATAADLAGGVWEAMLTTAAGLVVAIPTYAGYNYLASRLQGFVRDMERAGIELVHAMASPLPVIDFDEAAGGLPARAPGGEARGTVAGRG